jgi:hypothetical protein
MCVLILCTSVSETFIILRRTERDMFKNVHRSSYNVPVILVRVKWNLNFLYWFSKKKIYIYIYTQMWNFIKISTVWDELFHADGRTDGQLQTDRQTWQNKWSLFAIFRVRLKTGKQYVNIWDKIHSTIENSTTLSTKSNTTRSYLHSDVTVTTLTAGKWNKFWARFFHN